MSNSSNYEEVFPENLFGNGQSLYVVFIMSLRIYSEPSEKDWIYSMR